MIPYGRQNITPEDIEAVVNVLRSDWLTQGPAVPAFESALAQRCNARHAVVVSNATAALHIACLSLGVGPGDRVWTSPNTFVASANCARFCGASIDFVDIDPRTLNLSIDRLTEKLARARLDKCLPKVLIPVHFSGQPCDMEAIAALGREYGFRIIEDASHAVGATYRGAPIGNCDFSDITVFSFHPVKIITTGEGGAAMTNDTELANRMARLRSHGITRAANDMVNQDAGPWYYEQQELGYNYRMTDLQAALGNSQLKRLDSFLAARRASVLRYDSLLADLPVIRPLHATNCQSAWHLYPIRVEAQQRRHVFESLRANGIGVQVHYIPVHLQPDYQRQGFRTGDFPNAEAYYREALSLPLYADLTTAQQATVAAALAEALK